MRYMGDAKIVSLVRQEGDAGKQTAVPLSIPAGAYSRENEDMLRHSTGMSLKTLFNKIVAHNSPRQSSDLSPRSSRILLQRNSSLTDTSPRLRPPSMDEADYTSHILVSMPIPEDITKAVCELWSRRVAAARYWWLIDDIDFEVPNEDALFTVVRLALIERVRDAQLHPNDQRPVSEPGHVVLFKGDDTNMSLQKAIVAARTLTGGDPVRVKLLDHVLTRRVASPDYRVQAEEIPRDDDLAAWQATAASVLRHVYCADSALRNSALIDALCLAWEQTYILQD